MDNQTFITLRNQNPMILPMRETAGAVGYDLCNADGKKSIYPGDYEVFSTGVSIQLPEGISGDVRSRSGLAFKHRVFIPQGIGTIDGDYRGEIKVLLHNAGATPFVVEHKMRIAQLVLTKIETPVLQVVDFLPETARGYNGFGSTGL